MDYDKSQSPVENLKNFFGGAATLRYELAEEKNGKKKTEVLKSAWKNEFELKEITSRFQEEFSDHLIKLSMDEKVVDAYPSIIKECKNLLRKINRHYSPSFTDVMVLSRNNKNEEEIGNSAQTIPPIPPEARPLIPRQTSPPIPR